MGPTDPARVPQRDDALDAITAAHALVAFAIRRFSHAGSPGDAMRSLGAAFHALAEMAGIEAPRNSSGVVEDRHRRFVVDGPAPDHETPMAFLAKHYPQILECMDWPPHAVANDHASLARITRQSGHEPVQAEACAALQEDGMTMDMAYPVEQLARYYLGTDCLSRG